MNAIDSEPFRFSRPLHGASPFGRQTDVPAEPFTFSHVRHERDISEVLLLELQTEQVFHQTYYHTRYSLFCRTANQFQKKSTLA